MAAVPSCRQAVSRSSKKARDDTLQTDSANASNTGTAPRATQIARWISILAHPFVTAPLTVGVIASRLNVPGEAARTVAIFLLIGVVPGAALMIYQVRRGAWGNVDASKISERPILFAVATLSTLALLGWFTWVRPQPSLVRGILSFLAMTIVCAAVTRWIKASLHV